MEIDWRRKAACEIIAELPDDFEDAIKILEIAALYLSRMAYHQDREHKQNLKPLEGRQEASVLPFRRLSKI